MVNIKKIKKISKELKNRIQNEDCFDELEKLNNLCKFGIVNKDFSVEDLRNNEIIGFE